MMSKLDLRQPNRITWSEFLAWLDNEGLRREKRHDAQLYEKGLTRLVEGEDFRLSKNRTEFCMEHLVPIKIGPDLEVLLAVFENHQAHFLDIKTLKPISRLVLRDHFEIKEKVEDNGSSKYRSSFKKDLDEKTTMGALTIIDSHENRSDIDS